MEIGVIGLNDFSKTLCQHWIKKGHQILFADLHHYSHGYAIAESLGHQVSLVLPEKVGREAEVIVLSVSMKNLSSAVKALGNVEQKIVVDLIVEEQEGSNPRLSSFQEIQHLLPAAKVVKVTPHYPFHLYTPDPTAHTLYCYGNDHLAQRMVKWFVDGSGFKMIDLNIQSIL